MWSETQHNIWPADVQPEPCRLLSVPYIQQPIGSSDAGCVGEAYGPSDTGVTGRLGMKHFNPVGEFAFSDPVS